MFKKAQTEIIGLAVIMTLIILGMLFYMKFSNPSTSLEIKKDFMDTKLASNMLSVILRTTDECQDIDVKNLLQACAEETTTILYCDTYNGCERASKIINEKILDKTLPLWNKNYFFDARIKGNSKMHFGVECTGDKMSETYPIPTDKGSMLVKLDICR